MNAEMAHHPGEGDRPLLVLSNNSPVIRALKKSVLTVLEDHGSLCMDDENDRQTLAADLVPVVLIEIFGFAEWGAASPDLDTKP